MGAEFLNAIIQVFIFYLDKIAVILHFISYLDRIFPILHLTKFDSLVQNAFDECGIGIKEAS